MDKKTLATPPAAQTSLFDQTGDMLGHLGDKLADAKGTVVSFVTEEVFVVKKAARKIAKKVKKVLKKVPAKKAAKKAPAKKTVQKKKVVKKAVRKVAKAAGKKKKR